MMVTVKMADGKNFKTPKRRLVFEKYSLKETKQRHIRQIKDHYFNHCVSLLIPGCSLSTVKHFFYDYSPLLEEFCISVLPVHVFIEKDFIEKFIKPGHIYALSRKTRIDTENCVAVLPTGILLLSLDKDTYEELGLVGKQSIYQNKLRFNVEIDLKSPSFHPGKNLYERVSWCLKDHLHLEFEFILTWVDTDNKPDIRKLQSHFSKYHCHLYKNKEDVKGLNNSEIPVINSEQTGLTADKNNTGCASAGSFYEWLGSTHCDIDCLSNLETECTNVLFTGLEIMAGQLTVSELIWELTGQPLVYLLLGLPKECISSSGYSDSYISTFACPNPSVVSKEIVNYKWTGSITPQRIINLLEATRSFLQSSTQKPPWVALSVWGFVDAPISWLKNEHGYHFDGDNMYTIIIFPDDVYWFYMALGSHDVCS